MTPPVAAPFSPFQQIFDNFWNMPITSWQRFFNPQVVFNYNPEDEGVEYHVLQRVGSYGSQLSTVINTLQVLREELDETALDPGQRYAIAEFDRLRSEAERAVAEYRGVDADQLRAGLMALKQRDPAAYAALKAELD